MITMILDETNQHTIKENKTEKTFLSQAAEGKQGKTEGNWGKEENIGKQGKTE